MEIPTLSTGLHAGIPAKDYYALDRVNASLLTLMSRSPAHARHAKLNPSPSTNAQIVGTAVHMAVLEPKRFETDVIRTEHSSRTNAYKALVEANPERIVLSVDDHDNCQRIRDAVLSHPTAAPLVTSSTAQRELTAIFDFEVFSQQTGEVHTVACKSRIDVFDPEAGLVIDLKTTSDGSRKEFERSIYNYGYYRQLSFYANAVRIAGGFEPKRALFIAVEKEPPYAVAIYSPSPLVMGRGWQECEDLLFTYHRCELLETWPAYPEDVQEVTLPKWAW